MVSFLIWLRFTLFTNHQTLFTFFSERKKTLSLLIRVSVALLIENYAENEGGHFRRKFITPYAACIKNFLFFSDFSIRRLNRTSQNFKCRVAACPTNSNHTTTKPALSLPIGTQRIKHKFSQWERKTVSRGLNINELVRQYLYLVLLFLWYFYFVYFTPDVIGLTFVMQGTM